MGEHAPGIWRFGAVELDEGLAALRVAGRDVPLDRSSYDILLALLRHGGEVVTKDELLDAGWPGRVVSENSLAKAVSRLRHALGDDAAAIRVVHGYGYRLAAAVRCEAREDAVADVAVPGPADLQPGDPLAQRPGWRLERPIGHGASGVIWLAVDADGAQRAVKFANGEEGLRGLKREIAMARYLRTVRADFTAVAPVLGWNLAQPPYFLELPWYPDGSLRDWADARGGLDNVPLAERLALAIHLCEAVAALHQVGIIHRDLKPENIFPVPVPASDSAPGAGWRLVLGDLGASDAAASAQLAALGITMTILDTATASGGPNHHGSMLYIAPEVIAGALPTQRSDVFALGVLVYQLAVGDLRRSLAPGWEGDVDDELLREDIALAAAVNPERRLLSAHGLAVHLRDLGARRKQRDEQKAVERRHARMQHMLERARSRRPWLISTVVALVLGIAASSYLYAEALAAGRAAREQAAVADAVNRFFNQDVLSAASPYAQNEREEVTVREAIDHAVTRIDERLRDQPVVEATVRMTIGRVYGEAMQIAPAIEQERRAVALFERHVGLEDTRTQQARYTLAIDLVDDSRFEEAKRLIDGTDALRRDLELTDAETTLLSHRAGCYWHIRRQQYDAGQDSCEGVVASQLAIDASDHNALIKARANVAVLHSRAGRPAQAEEQFVKIDEAFAVLGDSDSPTRLRFQYLHGMNLLALERYDQAARVLGAAYRGSVTALGAENPHTLEAEMGMARLHVMRARHAQAVPLLQHAYTTYARLLGKDSHFTLEARRALDTAQCASGRRAAADPSLDGTPSACR
ncbi:MAG TPA: winged helix-turn-helix domain-containing protein [Xanthomonadaceae bacterium]|nr:winged helix-turn-helix domain-containing protein [Xanthomonadaceae bacterium]